MSELATNHGVVSETAVEAGARALARLDGVEWDWRQYVNDVRAVLSAVPAGHQGLDEATVLAEVGAALCRSLEHRHGEAIPAGQCDGYYHARALLPALRGIAPLGRFTALLDTPDELLAVSEFPTHAEAAGFAATVLGRVAADYRGVARLVSRHEFAEEVAR